MNSTKLACRIGPNGHYMNITGMLPCILMEDTPLYLDLTPWLLLTISITLYYNQWYQTQIYSILMFISYTNILKPSYTLIVSLLFLTVRIIEYLFKCSLLNHGFNCISGYNVKYMDQKILTITLCYQLN